MKRHLAKLSPAIVVASIALFVALTGTAVATTSALITGRQIANGSITGLDVKNRSLRPIDFRGSVRGPRGLQGIKGDKGDAGAQGVPGPFPDGNMPAGKTLRGNWISAGVATAGGEPAFDTISFGFRLAAAPTAHILAPAAAATPECPGSLAAPEAAAGHLCIHTYSNLNATSRFTCDPLTNVCGASQTNRYGTTVRVSSAAAGEFYSWGTWAVTST
jgi:hypothetical protein